MIDRLFLGISLLAFSAAAYRAYVLYRTSSTGTEQRSSCALHAALGFAFLLLSDSAQQIENDIYPNLGRLMSNVCTIFAALCIDMQMLKVSQSSADVAWRIRKRIFMFLAAIGLMAILFLSDPVPARIGDFGALYRHHHGLVLYNLVYAGGLGMAMVDLLALSTRYARHATRPSMKAGLCTVGAGCVVALIYLAEKVVVVLLQAIGLPAPVAGHDGPCPSAFAPAGCMFSVGFPLLAVLLTVIGMTLPAWGPRLAAPIRWARYLWLYRRLLPLWTALCAEFPQVVLPLSRWTGIRWRLHRQVIEVRDGLLALRPYTDAEIRADAAQAAKEAGLVGRRHEAAIAASVISAALQARRARAEPGAHSTDDLYGIHDLTGLVAEATWLAEIAASFTTPLTASPTEHALRQTQGRTRV